MKPYFSIIIPTLNEERFLPILLKDLSRQKEKNFEIIVVDGGSKDKTQEVVAFYRHKLPISFVKTTKKNVSFQRNYGAAKASGNYLIFLDADCQINVFFTKNLKKTVFKNKGLLYIPCIIPDEKNTNSKIFFNISNSIIELSQSFSKPLSSGGSMIVERNFFLLIGGFPENVFISEDHQLVLNARNWKVKAVFLPKIKIKFSLRRWRREGKLKMLVKVVYSYIYLMLNGKTDKKIFEYEMGGHLYKQQKREHFEDVLRKYLKQTKKFFDNLF